MAFDGLNCIIETVHCQVRTSNCVQSRAIDELGTN